MKYATYTPCAQLRPYIEAFAITEAATEQAYKVLPGTAVVLGFQYRGSLSYSQGHTLTPLAASGITGLQDGFRLFHNSADTGTLLVYFRVGGAVPFFGVPIHELFGHSLSLEHFVLRSELLVLEEQLGTAPTDEDRIRVMERFLCSRLRPLQPDRLVLSAIALIQQQEGSIRIKALAEQLAISQSALEKRFRKIVGASPKKFAAIIRMQHVLKSYRPDRLLTELGYEAGFYDQSHFIKEFSHYTGDTPEQFFQGK